MEKHVRFYDLRYVIIVVANIEIMAKLVHNIILIIKHHDLIKTILEFGKTLVFPAV